MNNYTYREAINKAIIQEMKRDSDVFLYGIDVADHKATFGTAEGVLREFGPSRCFSTPLAEDSMSGFGLGAALNGLRPINVHMRVDFLLLCLNQIGNMISSYYYGSNGSFKVPMVIRAIVGRGWGQAFQHSKSLTSIFAHFPGIKVVLPATPDEAFGLLVSAIRDDNPVLVIEHRWLYDVIGEVSENPMVLDKARCLREGSDITIIATSWMNVEAMKAAEILAKRGIEVELINACCATFLDSSLVKSVKKTGRCIVVDNDWLHCGLSAEISSYVYENTVGILRGSIPRIGFAPVPCPCSRPLESKFYPNAINIVREVEKSLGLSETDISGECFFSYEEKFKGPF